MRMRADPISAVLFDCDGVLVDSEGLAAKSLSEALAEFGFDATSDYILDNVMGLSRQRAEAKLERLLERPLTAGVWDRYLQVREEAFKVHLKEVAGASACIEELQSAGIKLAVVTQASRVKAVRNLGRVGLLPYLANRVFSAEQVNHGKPHPELYQLALDAVNVAPERTLTVDDREEGIIGGLSAGVKVLYYDGIHHRENRVEGVTTIHSLREVCDYVLGVPT
jgi:HAD superfamily hydrolase (TIGR01509 family)